MADFSSRSSFDICSETDTDVFENEESLRSLILDMDYSCKLYSSFSSIISDAGPVLASLFFDGDIFAGIWFTIS